VLLSAITGTVLGLIAGFSSNRVGQIIMRLADVIMSFPSLLIAVIVETIFGFPGVGKLMIDSILQRDFNVVLAAILVTALAIFLMNLLIDIAYALIDPRIRH
jgi:ABC-type dipeptide/oligopeptide/nickel transport system permease component